MVTNSNTHASKLVKAMEGWVDTTKSYSSMPNGVFGRKAIVKTWLVTLNSDEIDFEFTVPFDDDMEANEAEIIVYNLSKETISALHYNDNLTITAGYGEDTGLILDGYISAVYSKWEGVDKITTIKVLSSSSLKERDISEKTYAKGTKASYILKDLIGQLKMPLAAFNVKRDWTYKEEQKVSGGIMDNIKKYAKVCGISVYINNGKIYARHISQGDAINFVVSADTGLIGTPEAFEEEVTAEDYKDVIRGYKFKMLLQHRLTTGAIIELKSNNVSGTFRVRSGQHTCNEKEGITEVEVV